MKNFSRLALSKAYASHTKLNFMAGQVPQGTASFGRVLDLDDEARLNVLDRIGPKPNAERATCLRASGEALLLQERDEEAAHDLAAAIAFSGNFSEQRDFDKVLAPVVERDSVIVTQVAYNYFPIFEIWYRAMQRLGVHNILLIALDPLTVEKARSAGIHYWYLPIFGFQKSVRRLIWTETLKVRQKILNAGVNYLHSDADAIWQRDVRAQVLNHKTDFVTSMAQGTPKSALESWGFVMCLGFYFCRSNQRTRAIYDRYIEMTAALGHDQNGLNQLLFEQGLTWTPAGEGLLHGTCSDNGISVTAIPQEIVARPKDLQAVQKTGVMHPVLSRQSIIGKIELLKEFGVDVGRPESRFTL